MADESSKGSKKTANADQTHAKKAAKKAAKKEEMQTKQIQKKQQKGSKCEPSKKTRHRRYKQARAVASRELESLMGDDFIKYRTSVFQQVKEALMDRKRLNEEVEKLEIQIKKVLVDRNKLTQEVKELLEKFKEASLDRERLTEEVQKHQDRVLQQPLSGRAGLDVENSTDEIISLQWRVGSLTDLIDIVRNHTPGDILVKSGRDDEPAIPAHKAILSSKSSIFMEMWMGSSNSFKLPSASNEVFTFQELDHEVLKIFLDFLYSDGMSFANKKSLRKHATSLLAVAYKYEVLSLKTLCEREMLEAIEVANVLEYLESSDKYSISELKKAAMEVIKNNKQEVFGSSEFDDFAVRNPHLTVELIRGFIS